MKPVWRKGLKAVAITAACLLALRWAPHEPLSERFGGSVAVRAQGGELLRLTLAPDQQYRLWVPLTSMSPMLVDSVRLYEDRWFDWHPGVNPAALVRSAWSTFTGGRRQGGSTLTMQLARRLHGLDTRHVPGKLAQIGLAMWLEARHSKADILEAYLNTAPYGANIEGVEAASLIYFGKPAQALTMPEALTLAVIPQNPVKRIASRGQNAELQAARDRLWAIWQQRHPQDARPHAPEALLTPPARGRAKLPFLAPHLTDALLARPRESHASTSIDTTLDVRMQRTLERVIHGYVRTHGERGIRNASALLLDTHTMEVRAVVGSADYRDAEIEGQVNGTLAKRSPGSTLKPFIYALALDQGLLHPRTMLKDAPTSFGAFSPENHDGQFVGPVSAQDALIRSRNIPAVSVAARLSRPNLHGFLQLNQVSRLQSEEHYGLALVLGGGEVTMEELARLYAVLANGGRVRQLAYTREDAQAQAAEEADRPPLQVLSEEAAFITLDMLRQTPRPDTAEPARPPMAWKTGTSWGFRDAWTAGVFGRHVLVVWIGQFDGAGNPAFVGIHAAAPLFVRIVDALRAEGLDPGEPVRPRLPQLRQVEVCADTGGMPDALCPVKAKTWFIAGKSPIRASTLHRTMWVDERTGQPVCAKAGERPAHAREVVVEQWGSDMRRLFRQAGLPRRQLASACDTDQASEGQAPQIQEPMRGVHYVLRSGHSRALALRADGGPDARTLHWFADDALIGQVNPGTALSWTPPRPGRYVLRVVDDQGRADARELQVEEAP